MTRILAFIENDIYVRNFISSGAFSRLYDEDFRVCGSDLITEMKDSLPAAVRGPDYQHIPRNMKVIYRSNVVSMRALQKRSSTFRLKTQQNLYTIKHSWLYSLMAQPPFFRKFRQFLLTKLSHNASLETILHEHRPELVIFPVTGVESTGVELVQFSKKYSFKTLFLVNGWDNVSSKGVFPVLPDYLGVFGPQNYIHAVQIQEMPPNRVFSLGCARYEDYFRAENAREKMFPFKYIVFAGATTACDEITPLRRCDRLLTEMGIEDIKILYRPHPWREARNPACDDLFRPEEFRHTMLDPQVEQSYYKEKKQKTESVNSRNFPALSYYPSLLNHALFVISPMSSMTLEASLYDVPTLVLANDDPYHKMPPRLQAEYTHFEGGEDVPGWLFAKDFEQMERLFRAMVTQLQHDHCEHRTYRPQLRLASRYFLYQDEKSYAERLHDLVQQILACQRQEDGCIAPVEAELPMAFVR
jgi:hypothetical protein